MDQLKITMTGSTALIMHNGRLANPLDPLSKKMKEITPKRKKTEDDYIAMMEIEFEAGLYFDEKIGPYIPDTNLESMLNEAARKVRQGKDVKESLSVVDAKMPLIYKGPRDIPGMWKASMYDVRRVTVGAGSTVMRCRPIFFPWSVKVSIAYDASVINRDSLLSWLTIAGTRTGFMDNRPKFGKFQFEVNEG